MNTLRLRKTNSWQETAWRKYLNVGENIRRVQEIVRAGLSDRTVKSESPNIKKRLIEDVFQPAHAQYRPTLPLHCVLPRLGQLDSVS